jgi:hypothetical protein
MKTLRTTRSSRVSPSPKRQRCKLCDRNKPEANRNVCTDCVKDRYYSKRRGIQVGKPSQQLEEAYQLWLSDPDRNQCVVWTGKLHADGYGIGHSQTLGYYRAHKRMLEKKLGRPLQDGLQTMHSCHNRACIWAGHLSEGTAKENAGQVPVEKRLKKINRFNNFEVAEIREAYADGETISALARQYKSTRSVIRNLVSRRTYKDVA